MPIELTESIEVEETKIEVVVVAAEADPGIKTNHRTTATSVLLA